MGSNIQTISGPDDVLCRELEFYPWNVHNHVTTWLWDQELRNTVWRDEILDQHLLFLLLLLFIFLTSHTGNKRTENLWAWLKSSRQCTGCCQCDAHQHPLLISRSPPLSFLLRKSSFMKRVIAWALDIVFGSFWWGREDSVLACVPSSFLDHVQWHWKK